MKYISGFIFLLTAVVGIFSYQKHIRQAEINLTLKQQLNALEQKLNSSGKVVPANTIAFFNLQHCPNGWDVFEPGKGRFTISLNDQHEGLSVYELGNIGGEEKHQLTKQELPRHTHVYSDWYYEDRGKDPEFATGQGDDVGIRFNQKRRTEAEGNNAPHNNMPPYIALLQCIKV
ncbi:hypothetical protein JQC92_11620 [Shewanella sp. 202IG2-18]|uniref:hypothetical protein n=1 Tax=Parashewanella hymeniacidonis TaxID=2807618 RepID=UPI0019616E7A|nr:hypothetical protein [Parashewanella hymeniacidonis]MBM7072670.1 hypothetical protein [Parashewanella hymeniacidonis]